MRNRVIAAVLAFFFGGFGIHRFYLGEMGWGFIYILFSITGIPALIGMIEAALLLSMDEHRFNLRYNYNYMNGLSGPVNDPLVIETVTEHINQPKTDVKTKTEQIKELKELLVQGAIDQEEFERLKDEVLRS